MIVMTIEREWQDGIRFQKNVDKMQSTIYVDLISLGFQSIKLCNTKHYWVKYRFCSAWYFLGLNEKSSVALSMLNFTNNQEKINAPKINAPQPNLH